MSFIRGEFIRTGLTLLSSSRCGNAVCSRVSPTFKDIMDASNTVDNLKPTSIQDAANALEQALEKAVKASLPNAEPKAVPMSTTMVNNNFVTREEFEALKTLVERMNAVSPYRVK